MKKAAFISCRVVGWSFVGITAVLSGIQLLETASAVRSWNDLYGLFTFAYMSFVDNTHGGDSSNFFSAVGQLAISCAAWIVMTYKSPARIPRITLVVIYIFLAFCLAYGVQETRVGKIPYIVN